MSIPTITTGQPAPNKEAAMGQAIPHQHPAVVLRSHYVHLRAMLAIAIIAVIGLTVAVVVLATNDGATTSTRSAANGLSEPISTQLRLPSHARDHGGTPVPDLRFAPLPNGRRYDGGPEEGSRGIATSNPTPGHRYDCGPDEGSRGH
jgi:hypothetical protein